MNNDIRPISPRPYTPNTTPSTLPPPQPIGSSNSIDSAVVAEKPAPEGLSGSLRRKTPRKLWWIIGVIAAIILITSASAYLWYQSIQLPADSSNHQKILVTIRPGMTPKVIAEELHTKGLIRSQLGFEIYTRQQAVQSKLQVGSYHLSPSMNLSEIVAILAVGKSVQMSITFFPGATLRDPTNTPDKERTDVYTILRRAGFSDAEVNTALNKSYHHPLFADKPASASLEGYIYGETYSFAPGVTAEQVLEHTFDVYYEKIKQNHIIDGAKAEGLNLYQAITLASIIEREVESPADRNQVAQIFYRRLNEGMPLGADATFVYAANQQNQIPTIDFKSPYNTRLHVGLPPGPISSPSLTALSAVASPAKGDYLYFVSGDDGRTHFAHTEAKHQQNINTYCQKLCFQ